MGVEVLDILDRLVDILRSGGPWAVAAIFILMWWRKDSEVKSLQRGVTDLATSQVETNVKTERTLISVGDAMRGLADHVDGMEKLLDKILWLKQLKEGDLKQLPPKEGS